MSRSLRGLVILAALNLVALLPTASLASGWQRWCGGCAPACDTPCTTTVAKVEPKFEDRVVVTYKPEWKKKVVDVTVSRMVQKDSVMKVMVPVTSKEKRNVTEYVTKYRDEPYSYYVMVPKVVKEKVKVTVYDRKVKEVVEKVPVCRTVRVQCVDECGRCFYRCERVNEICEVKRCIVECTPRDDVVEVCKTICEKEERKGVRRVCEVVAQPKVIDVTVTRCEWQDRPCKVWECVRETEKRNVEYCEMVRHEEKVRVQVNEPCTTCETSAHGHRRLFSRRCCN